MDIEGMQERSNDGRRSAYKCQREQQERLAGLMVKIQKEYATHYDYDHHTRS